jgi:hypothetical protein
LKDWPIPQRILIDARCRHSIRIGRTLDRMESILNAAIAPIKNNL